jgi:hypothetical protein
MELGQDEQPAGIPAAEVAPPPAEVAPPPPADAEAPPHPTAEPQIPTGKCDICNYSDGHNFLVLIECTDCGVKVHRDCYGMPTFTERYFQCVACHAKDRTFEVEDVTSGLFLDIPQVGRPNHCDLCGHVDEDDSTVRALHPLYDNYGNKARQLYTVLDDGVTPRLAWAHTICGFFLATRQLLYATSRQGVTHEGDDADVADTRRVNLELDDYEESIIQDDLYQGYAPSHHFVWHRERKWTQIVKEHQKYLTCGICGKSDDDSKKKHERIFRVAVQCTANEKFEYHLFQSTHTKSLKDDDTCTRAYHVGCARYYNDTTNDSNTNSNDDTNNNSIKKKKPLRRVYYFPGLPPSDDKVPPSDDKEKESSLDPIRCIYCKLHAQDVNAEEAAQRELLETEESRLARSKRKRAMKNLHLTVDKYSVHKSTAEQQEEQAGRDDDEEEADDPFSSLLERMKNHLGRKVVTVTRENAQTFIQAQKITWQRLALSEDVEAEAFSQLWKQVKKHTNRVWKAHQERGTKEGNDK